MADETSELVFGIATGGTAAYPTNDTLIFGSEFANQDFIVPMAKFTFYDARGVLMSGSDAPIIYIRMPGQFSTAMTQGWAAATGIMGNPNKNPNSIFEGESGAVLGKFGDSFLTGIQKQIVAGVAGATGYAASAGQSGKAQVEFLQRKMLNTFQQLIYQGPTFRRFQLPFNMRPTSAEEAERMRKIIASFRIASAPTTGGNVIGEVMDDFGRNTEYVPDALDAPEKTEEMTDAEYEAVLKEWINKQAPLTSEDEAALDQLLAATPSVIAFGYPDMVKFELVLVKGANEQSPGSITKLFESDYCMIESVAVDYGGQNKMTFFGNVNGADKFYPTDVNFTISLQEANLITASKATQEYADNQVIF